MVSPPESVRRHFLSWDEPLLQQAVAFLARGWNGESPLDLSSILVVVPTNQSGRRLREELARFAADRRQAVFSPRVLTPNAIVSLHSEANVASGLEAVLAWADVLRELDLEAFRAVFPVDPPVRNFSWAVRLAREFVRLQRTLAEAGLRLGDVLARAGSDFPEVARWEEIAALESRQDENLARFGLRSESAARLGFSAEPELPVGIKRLVLLATPDPMPLVLQILRQFAEHVAVDVVIFAPPDEAASFDPWGRPVGEIWNQRHIELGTFEERVHVCPDPVAQADYLVGVAREYGDPAGLMAIGIADPEVLPVLEAGLRKEAFEPYNPEGATRRGDRLYQLLAALAALARDDAFSTVEALARCPDFLEYLRALGGKAFSAASFLAELDKLHARHLPPTLREARRHRPASRELTAIAELRDHLTAGTFPHNATVTLTEIFSARAFDLAVAEDARAAESAEAWASVIQQISAAAERFTGIDAADWWEIALLLYGDSEQGEDKPDNAIELQGWLELMWENSPHLVVAGVNDGFVPDAVVGDPFLPESLREKLGLKSNAERFARDAYILQTLAASRSRAGRLDLLVGKNSNAGDPLRPSRLLFRCPDEELPARVRALFRSIEAQRSSPSWQRAWKLKPRVESAPDSIAVTALRAWLECPFRFYLSRVLRMQSVDPGKVELDAMDFGTLCHAALEAMGREQEWRDCTDAGRLREFLLDRLRLEAAQRFGTELTLPLVVQLESARQRLSRAAEVQAQSRADGWVIERVEHPFNLNIAGLTVRGKIDRIDRHQVTGAVRVLDYKTSDRFTSPFEAHLRRAQRMNTSVPKFAELALADGDYVWKDLQLPLYLRALLVEFPQGVSCGYFNLPKASAETGIAEWDGFTVEITEAAWRCAEGVATGIRAGEFWPPNEEISARSDNFAALFHHGVAESVIWEGRAR